MSASFKSLAESVASSLQNLDGPDKLDDASKLELLSKLDSIRVQLAPPQKIMQELTQSSNVLVMTRVAIAMGVFDVLAANKNAPMSLEDLHAKTRGDTQFLSRVLRFLTLKGLLQQAGPSSWYASPVGAMMVANSPPAMFITHFYAHLRSHSCLLDYLESTDFRNPTDYLKSPWAYAYDYDKGYFAWLAEDDLHQRAFNTVMTVNQQYRGQDWFEFFPVIEKFGDGATTEGTLLVDIGGGSGHDALGFRNKFPDLPGKVVLQDLPSVVQHIKGPTPPNFEAQAYDAFTKQPVEGARAYYLRTVLHDWPEPRALEILKQVRMAMGSNSLLLINENLMPEENIPDITADVDFIMMNAFASLERTEQQWLELLDKAGFEVVKVWRPTSKEIAPTALFEAVPR